MYRRLVPSRAFAAIVVAAFLAGCGGGGSPPPPPNRFEPTPVTSPTSGGGTTSSTAYTCSTSDAASSVRRLAASGREGAQRRNVRRSSVSANATGLIAVTYAGALASGARSLAVSRESASGASLVREMTFPVTDRYERILHVTPGTEAQAIAALRTQANVVSASITGSTRRLQTVSTKYFSNDPYYNGFTLEQLQAAGDSGTAPSYHVDPYEENAGVGGQWGDHAVRLDYAQEYSQANNGSGITAPGALGSSGVKIAIIDSGEDSTQPELSGKIAYQKCFITNASNVQSTSSFSVDEDGHGTDVSGIAAASSNNNLGFVGTGGAASIYAYRVFPTPDDTCVPPETKADAQCDANVLDIAAAINDAVNNNVNVINLSLGGDHCAGGADEDTTEQNAVAAALAKKIVVVAASGNDNGDSSNASNTGAVSAPACINGVIAVGASALNDGQATGTASSPTGSSTTPIEYVAGYSQYGSPAAAVDSANAWGIVAPGGDPSDADSTSDSTDELHWIENIWTSTPFASSTTDTSFQGECAADFGGTSTTTDCRTLIAGTSQATPLVAGAVALIIAANPAYQSPASMKQLLCSTAHDIGDPHEGCGRLDLYRAMATALGDPKPPASQ